MKRCVELAVVIAGAIAIALLCWEFVDGAAMAVIASLLSLAWGYGVGRAMR